MTAEAGIKGRVAARLGARYVAGPELGDALACADRLGRPCALAYWDGSGEAAATVEARSRELAAALAGRPAAGDYLSLKLPPLGEARARRVALEALGLGVPVHFDSHAEADAERTLALALELAATGSGAAVGVTLPGAWSRSDADLRRAQAAGLRARIVKGQWPGDREPSAGFLELACRAVRGGCHVALASHDPRLLERALALAVDGAAEVEVELLYGLPARGALAVAERAGVPVRVYVPCGHGWLPYALSALLRRPTRVLWLAADLAGSLATGGGRRGWPR